jgi:hypothetical protein
LAVALLAFAVPQPAFAQGAAIVVAEFQGAKKDGVREIVVEVLTDAGHVVANSALDIDHAGSETYYADLAQEGGYRAFLTGHTSLKQSGWTTSITVRDGKTGGVIGKVAIDSSWYPGLQKALRTRLMARLKGPLERARAPEGAGKSAQPPQEKPAATESESEPAAVQELGTDEAEPEPAPRPAKERKSKKPARAAPPSESRAEDDGSRKSAAPKSRWSPSLELAVGPLFVYRRWTISDPLPGSLDGPLSPLHFVSLTGARATLSVFPFELADHDGVLRYLGIGLGFGRTFIGTTPVVAAAGSDRQTTFQELTADLRVRIPLGSVRLGVFGGVGLQDLVVAGEKVLAPQPDAAYRFFRVGADLLFPFGDSFAVKAGGAYRGVLTLGDAPGEIQSRAWFPNAKGSGAEGRLELTYAFSKTIGVAVAGTLLHYAVAFNPDRNALAEFAAAGDPAPPIAGGAVDWYRGGDATLTVSLD